MQAREIRSPFISPSTNQSGIVLQDNTLAAVYIFNTINGVNVIKGGHAALALEALIDGQYIAIRADIRAVVSNGWIFSDGILSEIKYQELTADISDSSACNAVCDIIFRQSHTMSSSSTNLRSHAAAEQTHADKRVKTKYYTSINIAKFHRIKETIIQKQRIFIKAYLHSVLEATNHRDIKLLLYKMFNTLKEHEIRKFIMGNNRLAKHMLRSCPKPIIYLNYCHNAKQDIELERFDNSCVQQFMANIPKAIFPVLLKLNEQNKLHPEYPKFSLFGPGSSTSCSNNCLSWAKNVLTLNDVCLNINTNKPKALK